MEDDQGNTLWSRNLVVGAPEPHQEESLSEAGHIICGTTGFERKGSRRKNRKEPVFYLKHENPGFIGRALAKCRKIFRMGSEN